MADDQYSNGSAWHRNGLHIRFKDWHFIYRACLNVVPLNAAYKYRFSNTSKQCCHCEQAKTRPQVICHCRAYMVQIRARHNSITERLTNAIRFGTITMEKTIKDSNLRPRPDIVVEEHNRVLIIDVTCPFYNDVDALSNRLKNTLNPLGVRVKYWHLLWVLLDRGTKKMNLC